MSDLASALPGASFDGACRIQETGLTGMITLRGNLTTATVKKAVTALTGVQMPGDLAARGDGDRGLLWMAPDELLILLPYDEVPGALETLAISLSRVHHLAANVSDARAMFTLSGPGAREVLGKLTPADLRPDAFGPGTVRRTRLAQVPAAFWMRDDLTFEVICFRSVARYVFDLLSNAAVPGTLPDHY